MGRAEAGTGGGGERDLIEIENAIQIQNKASPPPFKREYCRAVILRICPLQIVLAPRIS